MCHRAKRNRAWPTNATRRDLATGCAAEVVSRPHISNHFDACTGSITERRGGRAGAGVTARWGAGGRR